MSSLPIHELELRATDERQRLQGSVAELKSRVPESLDVRKNARKHVWFAGGILALFGFLSGYA